MIGHFQKTRTIFLKPNFNFDVFSASARLVFEEGYTVSTVLDGNKLKLNPHFILPRFDSSDFLVLDSEHSAFFTVAFTPSQESEIKRLSGNGFGFSDGDLATAMFNKPKSFAVDLKGNVYVADKGNLAIRKISKSGVTTIAGGSKTPGHVDGPGRNASFSPDFELAFIPERCALMICDHGHKLVRQINLKSEDCARGSHSELGLSTWAWPLALGVCSLLGLIIGFTARPYLTSREGLNPLLFNVTWKHYLVSQGRQTLMFCSDVRNAIVSLPLYPVLRSFIMLSLSQLSLMFRIKTVEPRVSQKTSVSLLDSDVVESKEITKSQMFDEQLKDLMTSDGVVEPPESADKIFEQGDDNGNRNHVMSEGHQKVDYMISAHIRSFEEQGKGVAGEALVSSCSGLVKRR
ncbi:hypothetical protein RHSIM_Rhsim12G0122100 [Rhododendron simsii]|uniref:NHL repeat-containing protein n=1 Tax=Rhododendron simsii TaxID=118357 RepID=A0A834L8H9_RHOSS|nr:hypothetical protein RHSIM_Rhsim12G0122100 [Rhododendron simsii]